MIVDRQLHEAVLLTNGKVLVAGGYRGSGVLNITEIYDPATEHWSETGKMSEGRGLHTLCMLTNGKALAIGGFGDITFVNNTELYDPFTAVWTKTGKMVTPRFLHSSILLNNGQVLVVGGSSTTDYYASSLNSAELYNPSTGVWINTGSISIGRARPPISMLANGKVLITGGFLAGSDRRYLNSAEVYDPSTGVWTKTGNMSVLRGSHTATMLTNGKILVAGGYNFNGFLSSAELYDPTTGVWTLTGSLSATRGFHRACMLANGKVLVVAGANENGMVGSAELYDPLTGLWTKAGNMSTARYDHTATTLLNGKVLVAGGYNDYQYYLSSAELYA
ncbi:unnamed protein product [Rotaria sp. Silwood2]|nr:unnamed protein product [Rotaria sp. Silwood2]